MKNLIKSFAAALITATVIIFCMSSCGIQCIGPADQEPYILSPDYHWCEPDASDVIVTWNIEKYPNPDGPISSCDTLDFQRWYRMEVWDKTVDAVQDSVVKNLMEDYPAEIIFWPGNQ